MNILWIAAGAAVGTALLTYWAIITTRGVAYHWRHAAHVIAAEEPELPPVAEFGAMALDDEIEWRQKYGGWTSGACLPGLPPWEDDPIWDEPDRGPGEVTTTEQATAWDEATWDSLLASFPPWQEPTRKADTGEIASAHFLAEISETLRTQDADAAEYLSRFRSRCAETRIELVEVLAAC